MKNFNRIEAVAKVTDLMKNMIVEGRLARAQACCYVLTILMNDADRIPSLIDTEAQEILQEAGVIELGEAA
ncbi:MULTISPECIES: hypothetical protein [unclassified Ruegeria]|uniref:hypothetical protein n=1 Tax=unclassified Ruegeria TaxID=2625375 RepID=UPI0014891D0A|nr:MULTISPECIES: hypothetical protein [unclassified Ruegeria]NOD75822.1 hypothetical protein [Ruegeria sp. HKCCD4332]